MSFCSFAFCSFSQTIVHCALAIEVGPLKFKKKLLSWLNQNPRRAGYNTMKFIEIHYIADIVPNGQKSGIFHAQACKWRRLTIMFKLNLLILRSWTNL